MALRYARSAFRHGISRERIAYVVDHCEFPLVEPEETGRDVVVFLGDDWRGVPLEVAGIELEGGDVLVIHAMRLRRKYADDYARVMGWRRP